MGKTNISWCTDSWSPIRGCWPQSPGCANCFAADIAARFSGPGQPFEGFATRERRQQKGQAGGDWTGGVELITHVLPQPLRWRNHRQIFVCSMSDLFQEEIDDDWIDQVFAVMWNASWHRYLVLTKRAKRLYQYLTTPNRAERIARTAFQQWCTWEPQKAAEGLLSVKDFLDDVRLPLDHVGIGVSVENQRMAELRLPWLVKTPAAKRFVSAEPLLSAIDLSGWLRGSYVTEEERGVCLSSGPEWRTRDSRRRDHLEGTQAGMGSLETTGGQQTVYATSGGTQRQVFKGLDDDEWKNCSGPGSSISLSTLQRADPSGNDDQSRQWSDGRQLSGQPGTGNACGAGPARHLCAGDSESGESVWREEPCGQIDRPASRGNPEGVFCQPADTSGTSKNLWGWVSDNLKDCQGSSQGQATRSSDGLHPSQETRQDDSGCDDRPISLCIIGAESGPNRRPMQLTWLTSLVEQCQEAGVKVHVKQDGAMKPGQQGRIPDEMWALKAMLWEQGE